ncbi:MAG: phytoene/squalene synthase family protein [Planctomycetota bacterium]|nr:phytoene/squalene synthase family protein [Planctomycetota bacterium]
MNSSTKMHTLPATEESQFFEDRLDADDIIKTHSKSFSLASCLLPKSIRTDVRKLYSWCRWCDNAVDEAESPSIASNRLNVMRNDIVRIFDGQEPKLRTSKWMKQLILKHSIPRHLPLDLLLGMKSDVFFKPLRNQADLETYCYRVAGVVGKMMCFLFGIKNERALEKANRLGMAMQMTNIARDVSEDWNRRRCYLPVSWLKDKHGFSSSVKPSNEYFRTAVAKLLDLAEQNYQIGYTGYAFLPDNTRLAIRIAASVYRHIGLKIIASNYQVLDRRHYVAKSRKIAVCLRETVAEFSFRVQRVFASYRSPFVQSFNRSSK